MNIEGKSLSPGGASATGGSEKGQQNSLTVQQRAAQHAALADTGRLQIADRLLCADLSPSELRQLLGMSSNLLAHHLKILEQAGLIERRRSEGDKRRGYTVLRPQARRLIAGERSAAVSAGLGEEFPGNEQLFPGTSQPGGVEQLVFVCTGNSARSPFAAAWWNQRMSSIYGLSATSAGVEPAAQVPEQAAEVAQSYGIDLWAHQPRRIAVNNSHHSTGRAVYVILCDRAYEGFVVETSDVKKQVEKSQTQKRKTEEGQAPQGPSEQEHIQRTPGQQEHPQAGRAPSASGAALWHWAIPNPSPTGTQGVYEHAFDEIIERIDLFADHVTPR